MERCQSEGAELLLCAPGTLGVKCIAQCSATELAADQWYVTAAATARWLSGNIPCVP